MSTSKKKDVVRGKRYTAEEKAKIVSFVEDYNTSNGRGGQSAASKKFGVSQLTVSTWLKNAGGGGSSSKSGGKGSMQNKLSTMLTLGQEIAKLDRELSSKRSKFEALKASL
jgi:transposase-like protein